MLTFSLFSVTEAVYFSQRLPEICLHTPSQGGVVLGQLYAYPNIGDNCIDNAVQYRIVSVRGDGADVISIDRREGWITLNENLTETTQGNDNDHVAYVLACIISITVFPLALMKVFDSAAQNATL